MRKRLALLLTAIAVGCSEPSPFTESTVVRDSAGVRIVENLQATWEAGEEWRLGDTPALEIGGIEGDPEQELYRVRDAFRLANGDIVVANAGTHELRFYDRVGAYLHSVGGKGGGPGEFQVLGSVRRFGPESLVAHDPRQHRLSFFDRNGEFGRSVPVRDRTAIGFSQVAGVFGDGTILVHAPAVAEGEVVPIGVSRRMERLFRYAADGESSADSVGWALGREMFTYRTEQISMGGPPHFGRSTGLLVRDDRYYVATNDSYEIKVYSPSGLLQLAIRKRHQNHAVTQEDIEALRERIDRRIERAREGIRQTARKMLGEMSFPETMPAFGRTGAPERTVHVDAAGNLWVLEYNRPGDESRRWTVFAADGVLLGTLSVPETLDLLDIGDDYVLGKWQDELDVEHVLLYELIKPGSPG